MALASEMATRIAALVYGDLPDDARRGAKIGAPDTIGAGISGANEACVTILCAAEQL